MVQQKIFYLSKTIKDSAIVDSPYADEAIIKYQPNQVFIYCGENDMADVDTVSPATVLDRFKTLHTILLKKLTLA